MKKHKQARHVFVGLVILLIIFAGFVAGTYYNPAFWQYIDNKSYDLLFSLRGNATQKHPHIVIVGIDDASLQIYGKWPWPRATFAEFLKKMKQYQAAVVAFDILFVEQSPDDHLFAAQIRENGNVVLAFAHNNDGAGEQTVDPAILEKNAFVLRENAKFSAHHVGFAPSNVLFPAPALLYSVSGVGHINMPYEIDGTTRKHDPLCYFDSVLLPSLGIRAVTEYLHLGYKKRQLNPGVALHIGDREIPLTKNGSLYINYRGEGAKVFQYISIADILQDKIDPSIVKDKIVFVGSTAIGAHDLRVSPVSAYMPGVETHANVAASILDRAFIKPSGPIFIYFGCFLLLVLAACWCLFTRAAGAIVISVLLACTPIVVSYVFFAYNGIWLPYIWSSVACLLLAFSVSSYRYITEERQARHIKKLFASYVSPKIVDELIANPSMAKIGGERREVSVLFADIVGYTAFSENEKPEVVVEMLNEFLREMTEVIMYWDGCVNKYVGDCIMAFWNAPLYDSQHAIKAARCALHMEKKMIELQEKWVTQGKAKVDIGIGINTGEVLVGNIGIEGKKMDYTVIGDTVNVCARVEGLTRRYNIRVLITEFTFQKIADNTSALGHIACEYVGEEPVKGRGKRVKVYKIRDTEKNFEDLTIDE